MIQQPTNHRAGFFQEIHPSPLQVLPFSTCYV